MDAVYGLDNRTLALVDDRLRSGKRRGVYGKKSCCGCLPVSFDRHIGSMVVAVGHFGQWIKNHHLQAQILSFPALQAVKKTDRKWTLLPVQMVLLLNNLLEYHLKGRDKNNGLLAWTLLF